MFSPPPPGHPSPTPCWPCLPHQAFLISPYLDLDDLPPPGSPSDLDFPDDLDGPPDDDFPPDDEDLDGPPDDDMGDSPPPPDGGDDSFDLPIDDDEMGPPMDDMPPPDDDDLPPPGDDFSDPPDSPVSKARNVPLGSPSPSELDPPPEDSSMGPPPDGDDPFDDMSMPPLPDDFSVPSLPPSSPPGQSNSRKDLKRQSSLGSLGPPPSDMGSIDDMPPPPDFPDDNSLPPPDDDFPPPSDSDTDSISKAGPRTKIAPRKAPMRPSTSSNRPFRASINSSAPDILSEGLAIKQPNPLQRSARIGGHDLGLNEFKGSRPDQDSRSVDSQSVNDESTLKSTAIETRPKLVRKGKGGKPPTKFKNMISEITMKEFDDSDTMTASDSKSLSTTDDPLNDRPFMTIPPVDYTSRRSSTRRSVLMNGEEFSVLQGRFEGDNFEELMVRIVHNTLCIKTEADPNVLIPFDLLNDAKIILDPNDDCLFTLTQAGSVITFKTPDISMLNDLLSRVPPVALSSKTNNTKSTMPSSERRSSETRIPFSEIGHSSPSGAGAMEAKGSDPRVAGGQKSSDFSDEFQFDDEDFYQYESGMMKADELNGDPSAPSSHDKHQHRQRNKNQNKTKVKPTTVVGKVSLRDTRPNFEDSVLMLTRVKGYDRKELIDTHLQKPKLSIRRMKQICKWMTSLNVWPRPIELPTLYKEICNGLLLAKIMSLVVTPPGTTTGPAIGSPSYTSPGTTGSPTDITTSSTPYLHLNTKALTKKAALENLEQALGVIWRSKCVNNYRIPTSLEIYNGNTAKICILMQEIFEVYVLKPLYAIAPKMFKWYHSILKQYGVPLPQEIFSHGDLINLWPHMQSGFDLFCVIYHLYGPVTIGEGLNIIRIDSLRIISNPGNILDYRANMIYIFSLLSALGIKIIWDVDDWITYPDTEFLVLQLYYIYLHLKQRQCSLPPAQGTSAGVTSGPNGEPMVTGMIFADTPTSSNSGYQRKRRTVLLGSGQDALPVLPIDTSGDAEGYFRMICPPGLISTNIKIVHSMIEIKKGQRAASERNQWNGSAAMDEIHDKVSGSKQLEILKSSHNVMNISKSKMKAGDESLKKSDDLENEKMKAMKMKLVEDMEALEQAMVDSNREMEELEEELANRYIELESLSGTLGPVEYNSRLNYLEKERLLLEEQRYKMQEHFSLRLSSLKERHSEAGNRLLSSRGATSGSSAGAGGYRSSSSIKSKTRGNSKEAEQAKLHRAERGWNNFSKRQDSHNYALGKGKCSPSSTFLSLAQNSQHNAQVDHAVVNKTGSSFAGPVGKGYGAQYGNTKRDVHAMWNQFKVVLKAETIKWASTRSSRHGNKIMELLNQKSTPSITTNKAPTVTTPVALSRSTRIPLKSSKSHNSSGIGTADDDSVNLTNETMGSKIRREELELMQFEETRRYLVIQEKLSSYGTQQQQQYSRSRSAASNVSVHAPPKSPYNPFQGTSAQYQSVSLSPAAGPDPRTSKSQMSTPQHQQQHRSTGQLTPFQSPAVEFIRPTTGANLSSLSRSSSSAPPGSPIVNPKNLDAIISWLAFPRNVFLRDRHTQQEYTIVIDSDEVTNLRGPQQQELPSSSSFVLKWFEMNARGNGPSSAGPILDDRSILKGYVYLQDIANLQLGGKSKDSGSNLLVLQLSSAARALKSSGGRTVLHLEFSSESECSKYFQELEEEESLQRNKQQQQDQERTSLGKNNKTLWYRVQKKLVTIQAMNAFKATGAEISRHRALSLLLEAIGRLHHSRFGSCTQKLNFAASVNRTQFRKEIHRVFGVKLSQFESDALFEVFDDDGNGILSAQELNNSFSQMIIEWRKRNEKDKQEKIKLHQISLKQLQQPKPFYQSTTSHFETISIPYEEKYFERAIVKITEGIVQTLETKIRASVSTEILLQVPDGNISEWYGKKMLKEQLNISLTKQEMRCLCMKLRGESSSATTASDSSPAKSSSSSSASATALEQERNPSLVRMQSKLSRGISRSSSSCSSSSDHQPQALPELPQSTSQMRSRSEGNKLETSVTESIAMISGKSLKTLLINLRNMILKRRMRQIPHLHIAAPSVP